MKKIFSFTILLIAALSLYAQTDGINYQAVIINPNEKELPGVNAQGNILPDAAVAIRFTILDSNNGEEYQEVQATRTDRFGMINLIIGQGTPTNVGSGDFTLISWDGSSKSLQVEIDFGGTGNSFVDMNRQELTFVPYAYHRNITATGTLTVDDVTDLNGELRVHGPTNLNSSLNVNNDNATNLSGSLTVGAATDLNDRLTVNGITNINDSLNINNQSPTHFSGDITVAAEGTATFDGPTAFNAPAEFVEMTVNGPSNLRGQVTVRANVDSLGDQTDYGAYPLLVQGSAQGIAIKVNESRSIRNNYISFWDEESGNMWGRIEGITIHELHNDEEFIWEHAFKITDIALSGVDFAIAGFEVAQAVVEVVASASSSTACVGFGACVTAPIPAFIIAAGTNLVLKIANAVAVGVNLGKTIADEIAFNVFLNENIGVSYQSGAGDYAEWLPKQNPNEVFNPGDIVGVSNGFITKNTSAADKIMVVSTRPIVLGNMPPENEEINYEKIAFMGQVPVKVLGQVSPGNYIIPAMIGSGFGRAVSPENMETKDYRKIAGVAWSVIAEIGNDISMVNVAVGINANDLTEVVNKQEEQIQVLQSEYIKLKAQIEQSNLALKSLVPGYAEAMGINNISDSQKENFILNTVDNSFDEQDVVHSDEDDIIYFEISRDQIEESLEIARESYMEILEDEDKLNELFIGIKKESQVGQVPLQNDQSFTDSDHFPQVSVKDHPFWQRIDEDPGYKDEVIEYIQSSLEKAMHTHKKHAHNFTDLKVKH